MISRDFLLGFITSGLTGTIIVFVVIVVDWFKQRQVLRYKWLKGHTGSYWCMCNRCVLKRARTIATSFADYDTVIVPVVKNMGARR